MRKINKTLLSVNLNKVALLRNARGEASLPDIKVAAISAINAGCGGVTFHPRVDKRHATINDIKIISELDIVKEKNIEINVEGDIREELLDAVQEYKVNQFTIVPVREGEKTTERGWSKGDNENLLIQTIEKLKNKLRIAIFVEPDEKIVKDVASLGVNAVEFHTKWYAQEYGTEKEQQELDKIKSAAIVARSLNLRVNLGHDLNLDNLSRIIRCIKPDEVSIGHALIADALNYGIRYIVNKYDKVMQW